MKMTPEKLIETITKFQIGLSSLKEDYTYALKRNQLSNYYSHARQAAEFLNDTQKTLNSIDILLFDERKDIKYKLQDKIKGVSSENANNFIDRIKDVADYFDMSIEKDGDLEDVVKNIIREIKPAAAYVEEVLQEKNNKKPVSWNYSAETLLEGYSLLVLLNDAYAKAEILEEKGHNQNSSVDLAKYTHQGLKENFQNILAKEQEFAYIKHNLNNNRLTKTETIKADFIDRNITDCLMRYIKNTIYPAQSDILLNKTYNFVLGENSYNSIGEAYQQAKKLLK